MADTDDAFISDEGTTVTHARVRARTGEWSTWLDAQGISRGDCIARQAATDASIAADRVVIGRTRAHVTPWRRSAPMLSRRRLRPAHPGRELLSHVRTEADFAPTVAFLTPSFCHLLLHGRREARTYRLTVLAGDACDEQTFTGYEQRYGCTLNLYGSTELGVIAAGSPDDGFVARRDTSALPPRRAPGAAGGPLTAGRPIRTPLRPTLWLRRLRDRRQAPIKPAELFR